MPRLFDLSVVRKILRADPDWSVYALGDLEPSFAPDCSWFWTPGDFGTLVLIYRGLPPPILFAIGEPERLEPLLDEIASEPHLSLHVRPEIVPLITARYELRDEKPVWRMTLRPGDFRPASMDRTIRLGPEDLKWVRSLFAEGDETGESPDYFAAASLGNGVFFGIWEGPELAAVAGTHLVSVKERVGAVGNVYTRRDQRGKGFAASVTSAVVTELLRLDIQTIALNVRQQNRTAAGVYERLGFRTYCEFREGLASVRDASFALE